MKVFGSINHYRADPNGWFGSVVMLSFAVIAFSKWQSTGFLFFMLLFLRDIVAVYFLLTRNQSQSSKNFGVVELISYLSSATPFFYLSATHHVQAMNLIGLNVLSVLGFTLSTLALFDLGKSFGVSPANRGKVTLGVYRFFSHPMYTGYAIAELGFLLLNPLNAIIYCFSMSLYVFRAKKENQALNF